MKTLLLTLALSLFATASLAENMTSIRLQESDMSLSLIKDGKILGVQFASPKCPPGARCLPAREMQILLTLSGCLDKLGPVTSTVQYDERTTKYNLTVTAIEINTKGSTTARCVRAKTETVSMIVPHGMDLDNTKLIMEKTMLNEEAPAPVRCTREFMPVCGVKPYHCPAGRVCAAVMPSPKTYSNMCNMKADGATLVSKGVCP